MAPSQQASTRSTQFSDLSDPSDSDSREKVQTRPPLTIDNEDDEEDELDEEEPSDEGDMVPAKCSHGRPQGTGAKWTKPNKPEVPQECSITVYKNGTPSQPIILDQTKYPHLLETALKAKKDCKVNLTVDPAITLTLNKPDKENERPGSQTNAEADSEGEAGQGKKKSKGKSKLPKVNAILPGNKAMNDTIGMLCEHWKCPTEGKGPCKSEYCFIPAEGQDHFPLNLTWTENWSAAILKGPNYATVDCPTNNATFDDLYLPARQGPSILQQCISAQRAQPAPSSAPIINNHLNFPPELLAALHGRPVITATEHVPSTAMLLPRTFTAGLKMSISDFCASYCPDNPNVLSCLAKDNFTTTAALQQIELFQLREMGLKAGDVAALQDAVEEWAEKDS
ncbi:hypothetical protein C8J56DRAFT_1052218 [Mycena floridula]|nr:hypothetical protein C8J56DRAFT_1052218 [Mycena floridula]